MIPTLAINALIRTPTLTITAFILNPTLAVAKSITVMLAPAILGMPATATALHTFHIHQRSHYPTKVLLQVRQGIPRVIDKVRVISALRFVRVRAKARVRVRVKDRVIHVTE